MADITKKPKEIKIVFLYYIVTSCLFFFSLPFMFYFAQKAIDSFSAINFILKILPIFIINLVALISAVYLNKQNNWARIPLIILSILNVIIYIQGMFFLEAPNKPQIVPIIYVVFSIYAIWALTRPHVIAWVKKKNI